MTDTDATIPRSSYRPGATLPEAARAMLLSVLDQMDNPEKGVNGVENYAHRYLPASDRLPSGGEAFMIAGNGPTAWIVFDIGGGVPAGASLDYTERSGTCTVPVPAGRVVELLAALRAYGR